jgi:type IV pilus assembly protein PilW
MNRRSRRFEATRARRSARSITLRRASAGLSLIEVMVALAISAILLFGLSQIFVGSKNVYRLQEGMSRVQENARFMLQYLESNVRMAGYMGCGNDADLTTKAGSPPAFVNHLRPITSGGTGGVPIQQDDLTSSERFQRPIEAYAYSGGSIDNQQPALGAAGDWTPALDAPENLGLTGADLPIKGSDVLVLRLVSAESTAMLGDFDMPNGKFRVADPTMLKAGQIYAITNCANARIFKASAVDNGSGMVTAGPAQNLLRFTSDDTSTWTGSYANMQFNQIGTALNAEVHPADYLVIYVGLRAADNVPVLKVKTGDGLAPQEVAEGVEMMKIEFGVDTDADGAINEYVPADDTGTNLAATNKAQRDVAWRKVLSVRIALLLRSPDRASESAHTGDAAGDNVYYLFDSRAQRPIDYRFRDVYTTTIALRNRLGNY